MARALGWCGVILAAGESTRMGADKALLPWPPGDPSPHETFLSGAIRSLEPFTDLVLVIVGKNESNLAPVIYACGAFLVPNPAPEQGQFSSLKTGLREVLNRGRDAAMVTLVDRPPVGTSTIQKLLAEFNTATAQAKWAVVPEYGGKHGHPILVGRELIEAFLKAPATATARDVEHQNIEHINYVPVDDPLVAVNVNTPEEYAALTATRIQ
jgi:molybdenum cofactor cytidylyltransferase